MRGFQQPVAVVCIPNGNLSLQWKLCSSLACSKSLQSGQCGENAGQNLCHGAACSANGRQKCVQMISLLSKAITGWPAHYANNVTRGIAIRCQDSMLTGLGGGRPTRGPRLSPFAGPAGTLQASAGGSAEYARSRARMKKRGSRCLGAHGMMGKRAG